MTDTPADLVRDLSALLAGTDVGLLELRTDKGTIRLHRDGVASSEAPPHAACTTVEVTAESVGVFLHRHPSRADAFVRIGQSVQEGDALGVLRIGSLLLPVRAPRDGVVDAILTGDECKVGFGVTLVRLREQG